MSAKAISIRPFIGATDFNQSRQFYLDLGFLESVLTPVLSLFETDTVAFYLQDAYVKDWVDNTMVFVEVDDVSHYYTQLVVLNLESKYQGVKLSAIRVEAWGSECFMHDPSGILGILASLRVNIYEENTLHYLSHTPSIHRFH